MQETLKTILEIQELDIKMIRLMRLKKERLSEMGNIDSLHRELQEQINLKEKNINEINKEAFLKETRIQELKENLKKLEAKQGSVKKVEEFNAITHEMSSAERERVATEQMACDLIDKRNAEEEIFNKLKLSLKNSEESSINLKEDIKRNIDLINAEGKELKKEREAIAVHANKDILKVYEKLLNNKKDKVVVPIENRICSGCHIALTAQHENMVRKCERMVFCEHCSRILYWQDSQAVGEATEGTKRRRRRATTTT
ncbi:MAG: C4-type zinc ribbon domain-containing protein [Chlamydiota bacterium]